MENKQIVKCVDCGKEEEYDMKPGYPRKYCSVCSAKRKAEYEAKQGNSQLPTTNIGKIEVNPSLKQTYSDKDRSIVAQCLTKIEYRNAAMPKHLEILESYRFYSREL